MQRAIPSWIIMLLALCLFPGTAPAADDEIWRADAASEASEDGYQLIDTKTLAELLKSNPNVTVIDVRADYEFEAGHIPGSKNLEFDLGDRMGVALAKQTSFESLVGPDKKQTLVIYCRSFR